MERSEVQGILVRACLALYEKDHALVEYRAHERTIAGKICSNIEQPFKAFGFESDADYNREGQQGDPKGDIEGNMIPDIIVHTRGSISGPNLVAVEIKGHWNSANRNLDAEKLRRLRVKYGYQFLYRLELLPDRFELIEVDPIQLD